MPWWLSSVTAASSAVALAARTELVARASTVRDYGMWAVRVARGVRVASAWRARGVRAACAWCARGVCVVRVWLARGVRVACAWRARGVRVACAWRARGVRVVRARCEDGTGEAVGGDGALDGGENSVDAR